MKKILILLLVCIMMVASVQAFEFTYTPDQVSRTVCYGPWYSLGLIGLEGKNYEDYPLTILDSSTSWNQLEAYHYVYIDKYGHSGLTREYTLIQLDPANPLPIGYYDGAVDFIVVPDPSVPGGKAQSYHIPFYLHVSDCSAPPTPVPEFPSAFLPLTMIIGIIGIILLIRRTKEH